MTYLYGMRVAARIALICLCLLAPLSLALASSSAADPVDVCANIDGIQDMLPAGYVQNGANCDPLPDVCDNYAGTDR